VEKNRNQKGIHSRKSNYGEKRKGELTTKPKKGRHSKEKGYKLLPLGKSGEHKGQGTGEGGERENPEKPPIETLKRRGG